MRERFTRPVLFMGLAALLYLDGLPTAGNDLGFELAGAAFAALWTTVVAARIAFAYGATDVFPHAIATFSRAHDITGSDAWTTMFVLMAFGMVVGRLGVLALQAPRHRLTPLAAR